MAEGIPMGRANWRLYLVILMALLAFNGFTGLLRPINSGAASCGSVFYPMGLDRGEGFNPMGPFSFDEVKLQCPNTIIRANQEVIASFVAVGLIALSLVFSKNAEQAENRRRDNSRLPPPPDAL